MKIKKTIPYITILLASIFLTPIAFKSIIKKANEDAKEYISSFDPVTSELPDGLYLGKFKTLKVFTLSKIEFQIKDGKVINVNLKKLFHSPGSPYKEEIEYQIKQTKRLEVNAISGATRTSNFAKAAIKSAIEKKDITFTRLKKQRPLKQNE